MDIWGCSKLVRKRLDFIRHRMYTILTGGNKNPFKIQASPGRRSIKMVAAISKTRKTARDFNIIAYANAGGFISASGINDQGKIYNCTVNPDGKMTCKDTYGYTCRGLFNTGHCYHTDAVRVYVQTCTYCGRPCKGYACPSCAGY